MAKKPLKEYVAVTLSLGTTGASLLYKPAKKPTCPSESVGTFLNEIFIRDIIDGRGKVSYAVIEKQELPKLEKALRQAFTALKARLEGYQIKVKASKSRNTGDYLGPC